MFHVHFLLLLSITRTVSYVQLHRNCNWKIYFGGPGSPGGPGMFGGPAPAPGGGGGGPFDAFGGGGGSSHVAEPSGFWKYVRPSSVFKSFQPSGSAADEGGGADTFLECRARP